MIENQRTIRNQVMISGVGLHTGQDVNLKLAPVPVNTGVRFFLNTPKHRNIFQLTPRAIIDTTQATTIGGDSASISTIEHLLSALHAFGIDNVDITVVGEEIPILDGSALPFVHLIKAAGVVDFDEPKEIIRFGKEEHIRDGDKVISYTPADDVVIDFTISFSHPLIAKQTYVYRLDENTFEDEIAPARTFGFLQDVEKARAIGLIKGGSLENSVVLDEEKVINPEGLRFEDAFVRHKILDFIGDIYAIGNIRGHFEVQRSGHGLNNLFLKEFSDL